MKQITINGKEILMVEVPEENANQFSIHHGKLWYMSAVNSMDENNDLENTKKLPPGNWKIIGKGNEIEEKDWDKIVERRKDIKDWPHKGYEPHKLDVCWNATQSGHSLILSHQMKPEQTLILERVLYAGNQNANKQNK